MKWFVLAFSLSSIGLAIVTYGGGHPEPAGQHRRVWPAYLFTWAP